MVADMEVTNRLTIEEVEGQMQNFYGAGRNLIGNICKQLLDSLRENEQMKEELTAYRMVYNPLGHDVTTRYQLEQRNKDSDNG
jgi:membrane-bound lytic murein transglycosylase MltF